jgi:hypothetical protein
MQRQLAPQGPAIDNYVTQQQALSQQTAGTMEFRDCQNPNASDGYVVGPDEKVSPGSAATMRRVRRVAAGEETACARWHRTAQHSTHTYSMRKCDGQALTCARSFLWSRVQVPGYAPDYIKSQPHRELTEEECAR